MANYRARSLYVQGSVCRTCRAAAAMDKRLFRSAGFLGMSASPIRTSSEIDRSIPVTRSRPHLGSKFSMAIQSTTVRSTPFGVRTSPELSMLCSTDLVVEYGNYAPCTTLVSTLHDRIVQLRLSRAIPLGFVSVHDFHAIQWLNKTLSS